MPKETRKTTDRPYASNQHRVCETHSAFWWRGSSDDSFQHFPYPTPSASGDPSVFTRSQRRRQQGAEGPPHPQEPLVAIPTAPVENEGPSVVREEV